MSNPESAPVPFARNAAAPLAAILATTIWGALGAASLFVGAMAAMLFDAPGSENDPRLWIFAGSIWAFPVFCVVSIVGSWLAWWFTRRWGDSRAGRGRTLRLTLALLPVLDVVAMLTAGVVLANSG